MSEKISEDDEKVVVENNKRDENVKSAKNDEQNSVENNKREEKEKATKANEDEWIKPLNFEPFTHFYEKQ